LTRTLVAWGLSWAPAALWAAVLFLLSARSDLPGSGWLSRIPGGDKLAHLGAYAVLGACLAWGQRRQRRGAPAAPGVHALLILVGALYGILDEFHQAFVPGREVSAADWIADVCGVTLGYLAASSPTPDPEPS
jgi:VanZ family protein